MSAALSTPPTKKQRRRAESKARRLAAEAEKSRLAEDRAEAIAPAAQRKPVVSSGGVVLRGPRLEAETVGFRRANPLRVLAANAQARLDGGLTPTISERHIAQAQRLIDAWDDGIGGIGLPSSVYGERSSGAPATGYISDAKIKAINHQIQCRREVEAAASHLGALWPHVLAIIINGVPVTAWARTTGMDRKAAPGYLAACLDKLVEFYAGQDAERPRKITAVAIVPRGGAR